MFWVAVVALFCGVTAPVNAAEADAPITLSFDISEYRVEGNTLLSQGRVAATLKPFTGSSRTFSDIEAARHALQQAYADAGYGAVSVAVPEQEIQGGIVRLAVIEAKVRGVEVIGNEYFDAANIRASLPSLVPGVSPNTRAIAHELRLANENPSKRSTTLLRTGRARGEVDVLIRVEDSRPARFFASLDNTGSPETGMSRVSVGYQDTNVFNRDQTLTMQYTTSPEKPDKVSIYGLGYRWPLYSLGDAIDLFAGYSDVNSGTVQGLFNVSGSGTIFGARYHRNFHKIGDYEHQLTGGLDYRAYQNNVDYLGTPLGADVTVHPISLSYSGLYRVPNHEGRFYLTLAHNIPGGNKGNDADFAASRAGADANYTIFTYGANYTRRFESGWSATLAYSAQFTREPLVAGEQFGLGGYDSVRGFHEREIANDRGYRGSIEVLSPELAPHIKLENASVKLLTFYDFGRVRRIDAQPDETVADGVASAGFGLRMTVSPHFNLRLDYAWVLDPGGTQGRGDGRLHAGLTYVF
jgi:hemolysin activation/secretion protein